MRANCSYPLKKPPPSQTHLGAKLQKFGTQKNAHLKKQSAEAKLCRALFALFALFAHDAKKKASALRKPVKSILKGLFSPEIKCQSHGKSTKYNGIRRRLRNICGGQPISSIQLVRLKPEIYPIAVCAAYERQIQSGVD